MGWGGVKWGGVRWGRAGWAEWGGVGWGEHGVGGMGWGVGWGEVEWMGDACVDQKNIYEHRCDFCVCVRACVPECTCWMGTLGRSTELHQSRGAQEGLWWVGQEVAHLSRLGSP